MFERKLRDPIVAGVGTHAEIDEHALSLRGRPGLRRGG